MYQSKNYSREGWKTPRVSQPLLNNLRADLDRRGGDDNVLDDWCVKDIFWEAEGIRVTSVESQWTGVCFNEPWKMHGCTTLGWKDSSVREGEPAGGAKPVCQPFKARYSLNLPSYHDCPQWHSSHWKKNSVLPGARTSKGNRAQGPIIEISRRKQHFFNFLIFLFDF